MFATLTQEHSHQQIVDRYVDVRAEIGRRMSCEMQQNTKNNGFASHGRPNGVASRVGGVKKHRR